MKQSYFLRAFVLLVLFTGPLCVYGQSFDYVKTILQEFLKLLGTLVPIITALALIMLMWSAVELIRAGKDETRTEGRKKVMWGVIALFVLVSVWGIVVVLQGMFFTSGSTMPNAQTPKLPSASS